MKIEAEVTHYEPGRAVGIVMSQGSITDNDDVQIGFDEWPIEYVAEVPGVFDNHLAVVGSDDGKHFKLLMGLYVDGKQVDLTEFYGDMAKEVMKP
jgi:hypothetical protein